MSHLKAEGIYTKDSEKMVPLSRLVACETQAMKNAKVAQSMAKQLKIAVHSEAMPKDWTRKTTKLLEQAEGVKSHG